MVDIGGWASKLVFLHSSSLTNLCLRGLILTMSILASVMFGTVHSMLYIFLPQPNLRQLGTFLIVGHLCLLLGPVHPHVGNGHHVAVILG